MKCQTPLLIPPYELPNFPPPYYMTNLPSPSFESLNLPLSLELATESDNPPSLELATDSAASWSPYPFQLAYNANSKSKVIHSILPNPGVILQDGQSRESSTYFEGRGQQILMGASSWGKSHPVKFLLVLLSIHLDQFLLVVFLIFPLIFRILTNFSTLGFRPELELCGGCHLPLGMGGGFLPGESKFVSHPLDYFDIGFWFISFIITSFLAQFQNIFKNAHVPEFSKWPQALSRSFLPRMHLNGQMARKCVPFLFNAILPSLRQPDQSNLFTYTSP